MTELANSVKATFSTNISVYILIIFYFFSWHLFFSSSFSQDVSSFLNTCFSEVFFVFLVITGTRRYCSLRRPTSSSCGGLQPRLFSLWEKKLILLFWPILGDFWYPLVALGIFSIYHSNFEKNNKKY